MLAQQRIFPRAVRAHGRILSRPSHIAWRSAAGSASEAHALPSSSLRDRMAPEELVEALDRHVVGQEDAKKALSIAIRSRWRRSCLEPEMRADTTPVNILMRGPTGTGKTEIARRVASLCGAPFVKVEATSYTEAGIVGQDTTTMIQDLVQNAIKLAKDQLRAEDGERLRHGAVRWVVETAYPEATAEEVRAMVERGVRGDMDAAEVEIAFPDDAPEDDLPSGYEQQFQQMMGMMKNMMQDRSGGRPRAGPEKLSFGEAVSRTEEAMLARKAADPALKRQAIRNAEENGIVFIDEVDKVADSHDMDGGRQSRHKTEGVQKELLSIVEGTTLNTHFGPVRTDHMLFVCAGAFHNTRPTDLMPELQGRLPIRVQLNALTLEDLERILVEPRHALLEQTSALLATEGLNVEFTECGVKEMARIATVMNRGENIGARRLRTVVSKVTEDISYNAPTLARRGETQHVVDAAFVKKMLSEVVANNDLSRYVL